MNIKYRTTSLTLALIITAMFMITFQGGVIKDTDLDSRIFRRKAAKAFLGDWGKMDIYTKDNTATFGTEGMFTSLTDIMPGKSLHQSLDMVTKNFYFYRGERVYGFWRVTRKRQGRVTWSTQNFGISMG